MNNAYINIGSNLGDRHGNIAAAVAAIKERIDGAARVSDPIESAPWGYESENSYINIGVAVVTPLSPFELLDVLQEIEREISPASHRNADGSYADRLIDIDLIAVDNLIINTPRLVLPHPRMHLRPFVTIPLRQLAPHWHHPLCPNNFVRKSP